MFISVENDKAYINIINQIYTMIISGTLKSGDRLPPERELTVQLNVSRTALREALKGLEFLGIIDCKHGNGTFVSNNVKSTIIKTLSIAFKLNNGKESDILQLRYILEIECVKTAAKKATDNDILQLKNILEKLNNVSDQKEKSFFDQKFHYYLISISDNLLFNYLADSIFYLMEQFIFSIRSFYIQKDPSFDIAIFEQHNNIINAIEERNPEKAASIMHNHLQIGLQELLEIANLNSSTSTILK
ncbi:transcriptional regulator [Desulfosporosinus orientis DSM 765]|uniref:Transcriptional regulator n=1 Tax=Desulfosporosinus orientis (strain ATCC 19365 / DSM 765 / NCIMB 8382 / VKM B-1628 / Singapore I) TaxID=768706 RepID=G7WAM2_DESOD|nr:FadR/GntR family transcriptional regulator [Desulfosporosinus orientis]AET66790.1 transcriptional regulator [Desulfosporosinus orientis DSM 765]